MLIKFVISVILLATALTAHSTPIRAYFAGQIDTVVYTGNITSAPVRTGERISGWVEMDWDWAYNPLPSNPNFYNDGLTYKFFIGDGSKSIWTLTKQNMVQVFSDTGVGLPEGFYDMVPQHSGFWSNIMVDDLSFGFTESGGTFAINNVLYFQGNAWDFYGSFLFTEEFVMIPEPSLLFLMLIALAFLLIVRSKTEKMQCHGQWSI
jgi:hypothetical protein